MFLALYNYLKFSLKSTLKNTQKRPQLWIYKSEKHKVFTFGFLLTQKRLNLLIYKSEKHKVFTAGLLLISNMVLALQNYFYIFAKKYQPLRCIVCIVCKIGTFPSQTMLCIGNEWKNRSCSTDEDGYHGGESRLLQELTAFFKASNISTRGKSGPSLSRSLVVSHGCFLPMGLGHPLLLGSNCRISVARIPYGANEGLSG